MLKKFISYSATLLVLVGVGALVFGTSSSAAIDDFSISLQLADHGCVSEFGQVQTTAPFSTSGNELSTAWAVDANAYDPDCVRTQVNTGSTGLPRNDFQICVQAVDHAVLGSNGEVANYSEVGETQCTPMASDGGGWSGWAADANYYDFDSLRMFVKKSDELLPEDSLVQDLRVGLQLSDHACTSEWGPQKFTPWYSVLVDAEEKLAQGDTSFVYDPWSNFAFDSNAYDPDCIRVALDVELGPDQSGPRDPKNCQPRACQEGFTFDSKECECIEDKGGDDENDDDDQGAGDDEETISYACSFDADPAKLSKDSEGNVIGRSLLYWRCYNEQTDELAPGNVRLSSNTEVFGIDKSFNAQDNVYVSPSAASTLFSLFYDGEVKATVVVDVTPAQFDEVTP